MTNILVVCGRNKKRSRTAAYIFRNDQRFNIRSAGMSQKANHTISTQDIKWADLIFVMENGQKSRISGLFRELDLPPIEVLDIEDEYDYMQSELVEMLTQRINDTLKYVYKI